MSSFSCMPLPIVHQDYSRLLPIARFLEAPNAFGERLTREFPFLVDDMISQSLDPTRTGRTSFDQLSPEEKKNLGSLIETRIRDLLGVSRSSRDLLIIDEDVDVKNTTGPTWMIPQESYLLADGEAPGVLLLSQYSPIRRSCNLGLIVARQEYLTAGQNRDRKLSISSIGRENIWWLLRDIQLPPDIWAGVNVARLRELRQTEGGKKRAAAFFREHLGVRIERAIVQSLLFDQKDYMKRLRSNGGARDLLTPLGIALRTEDVEYHSADGGKRWYSFWLAKESEVAEETTPP
jgi:hypothetical protein